MFKRRDEYLMVMDVEVDYSPVELLAEHQGHDLAATRQMGLESLIGHVRRAAIEAVREEGQKWIADEVDPEGEWPMFKVSFKGDADRARAAFELWGTKVDALNRTARILSASLRGSDGSNLQYVDEEYANELKATWEELPQDAKDMVDRLTGSGQQYT